MPQKKCGFGFSCASMMMQPGLEPKECPNWKTCGKVQLYEPHEIVELQRVRLVESRRQRQVFRITRHQSAIMMLKERGGHQELSDFGIEALQSDIAQALTDLQEHLEPLTVGYVAPEGVNVHRYSVKRPGYIHRDPATGEETHVPRVYTYNKLLANSAMFEPAEEERPVRAIHLSRDSDPRNLEGRLGIERRNRLMQVRTRLQIAVTALAEASAMAKPSKGIAAAPMQNVLAELQENTARTQSSEEPETVELAEEPTS